LVFVTVMIFACTLAAASHDALKQPANRIPHLFTGAEFSVNLVTSQAGKRNRQTLWSRWLRADFGHRTLTDCISESERRARLTCEFETRQRQRAGIDIPGEPEHLKSASKHFGMQQRLQRAFGLAIGISGPDSTA
jgi:hypothetical protein